MKKYTIDYFIKKFEAIPEELWCTGQLTINGKHCALGHTGIKKMNSDGLNAEGKALLKLFGAKIDIIKNNKDKAYKEWFKVSDINDSAKGSPKQNILNKLKQIKNE